MKILFLGTYKRDYARNSVLINGLKQNGAEVIECHDDSPGLKKFIKLFLKHWKLRNSYDVMFVAFFGQIIMPFAWFINLPFISFRRRKPIVFDAFMSLYDSNVFGRQKVGRHSLRALYYWLLDWVSMHLGDLILFDTEQHINYIAGEFGVSRKKLAKIFVGTQEEVFFPRPRTISDLSFRVLFHSSFIKSHGLEFIIRAAKILEGEREIKFILIGDGQVRKEMIKLVEDLRLKNMEFSDGFVPLEEIASNIAQSDVCLGLFGKPAKIQRVIPNKVFEYAAMARPIITADTPAIREMFDENDLFFVDVADPEGIAGAILELKNNPELRRKLAENAYQKSRKYASTMMLGAELKKLTLDLQARL